jgi:hypothetical protein
MEGRSAGLNQDFKYSTSASACLSLGDARLPYEAATATATQRKHDEEREEGDGYRQACWEENRGETAKSRKGIGQDTARTNGRKKEPNQGQTGVRDGPSQAFPSYLRTRAGS